MMPDHQPTVSQNLLSRFRGAAGSPEDAIDVNISYDIIRQFSKQLYTNPRKAVEELICNSYDAGASECHVRIPLERGQTLAVLDNGSGMDLQGLRDLWHVAVSPKAENASGYRLAFQRAQIGKFGVGKLAAFALGARLTHVTSRNGETRIVTVGQSQLRDTEGGGHPAFDVYKLTDEAARAILAPQLSDLPLPWEKGWRTWTLAIVDEIEEANLSRSLKPGFLRRMVSHALPVSTKFRTYIDGQLVPHREIDSRHIVVRIDVADPPFRARLKETLKAYWQSRMELGSADQVPPELYDVRPTDVTNPEATQECIAGIEVPRLGKVSGSAIITDETLTTDRLAERGYSDNGFAIYVHGKQINPEDELFGVSQRTHQYWRRFLAQVEMPGLDRALLVQRNTVSESFDETLVARELLRELFNEARGRAETVEETGEYVPPGFGSRLRSLQPLLGPAALRGLATTGYPVGGLEAMRVDFRTLGSGGPAVLYEQETNTVLVNEEHPTVVALDDLGGPARTMRHVLGEVLAGTLLSKGYLRAQDVPEGVLEAAFQLTYDSLLSAVGFLKDPVESHIQEIEEASYEGGKRFEAAVVRAFRDLRLSAVRVGGPDAPDGIFEVPRAGQPNLKVSVEAKGAHGIVTHAELGVSTVDRHRREAGCERAVAIAREYQVRGTGGGPSAVEREAEEARIPLLTTQSIATLLRLNAQRPFTHDKVIQILSTWKEPAQSIAFIDDVWETMPSLGLMRDVLEVASAVQDAESKNFPEPGMILPDPRIRTHNISRAQLVAVLDAIAITTQMIVIRSEATHEFELLAHPDTILRAMEMRSIEARKAR